MAPLTNPRVTTMLRLNITLQPTANDNTVSKPVPQDVVATALLTLNIRQASCSNSLTC